MNVIGIFVPKITMLLAIWIPHYTISDKIILTVMYICKFVLDYDRARPGHSGRIYKITKRMEFDKGNVLISIITLISGVIYEIVAILFKAWIPAILGGISVVLVMVELISNIWELIDNRQKRMR